MPANVSGARADSVARVTSSLATAPMLHRILSSAALLALLTAPIEADTLYVDANLASGANDGSSWADAFQGPDGLQAALAAALAGDEIFAAQGTYRPSPIGARGVSFLLIDGVALYGGFLGTESTPAERPPIGTAPSVLDGDLLGNDAEGSFNDNSFHVVHGNGTDASAVLDGFTVRGGNANGLATRDRGAGMLCDGASPTVRNSSFVANRSTFGGAAVYVQVSGPTFTDCNFEDNLGGTYGGAFNISYNTDPADVVRFDRCTFVGNSAARGGALEIFESSSVVLVTNSLFRGNTSIGSPIAAGGGAMWIDHSINTRVRGCTVVANTSIATPVGGIQVSGFLPTITNLILWDNVGWGGDQEAANQIGGTSLVTYSVVEGGLSGTGNLASDPLFRDPGAGDYRLSSASPAIDAGENASVPAGIVLDLARNPRFADLPGMPDTGAGSAPVVDIGAYEFAIPGAVAYCFGDGAGSACPCLNDGSPGNGCANGIFAIGSNLSSSGVPSISNDDFVLIATQSTPGQPGIFLQGDDALADGDGVSFGDGLRCAGTNVVRIEVSVADGAGVASSTRSISVRCNLAAGDIKRYQWWYRDPPPSPCGMGFNLSNALEAAWAQ